MQFYYYMYLMSYSKIANYGVRRAVVNIHYWKYTLIPCALYACSNKRYACCANYK